jgi:Fuc2NAc and GlcNAc transferase
MFLWLSVLASTFLGSLLLTYIYRYYALTSSLIDIPNHRSSHLVPTPRGGGISIVITYLLTVSLLQDRLALNVANWGAFVLPGVFLSIVSYIDDRGHVRAGWRLVFQVLAASVTVYLLGGLLSISLFGYEITSLWGLSLLAIIGLVWLINLYNFMDGIDGIAGVMAISVSVSLAVLLWLTESSSSLFHLSLILAAATAGFLWFNFPKASIFMGDVGSCFLGLILGVFILKSGQENQAFYWAMLILLGTFILDATITLIRRAWRRQKIYMAHREHAYQHLSRHWKSHSKVTLTYGCITLMGLLPIAALVVEGYLDGFLALLIAYFPLGVWLCNSGAGVAQPAQLSVSNSES